METGSYLLCGMNNSEITFKTTSHGSGRIMSRRQAKKKFKGRKVEKEMKEKGIYIRALSYSGLAEEAGLAYKDIDEVVDTVVNARQMIV